MSSFESTDAKHEFAATAYHPGYVESLSPTDDSLVRRRDAARKKDVRKDRKDKGYIMFEQEDSEEELVVDDANRSPTKAKKHVKPTFKFVKKDKEKLAKPKDKEKDDKKDKERKDKVDKEKEKKDKVDKLDRERDKMKEKVDKVEKKDKVEKLDKEKDRKDKSEKEQKKEEDIKWRAKKKFGPVVKEEEQACECAMPVFGVLLPIAIERSPCHDGVQLPVVVRECIDYIEEYGLSSEGIYRISGVKSKVQALKDAYNKGIPVYLHDHEPNDIASLLKQYFRDLPEPVLTAKLMPKFEQASTIKTTKEKVEQFEALLKEMPLPNRILLSWMIVHMTHVIAKEKLNKMTLQNVSIVLSPTMQISHRVLNIFFGYAKILFRDTVIKRYVPPLKPVSSRWSLELPDSPSAIEEELTKQESLLNHLHEELMKVKDLEKEEQLWEVQRVVTQLKRKLKHARQVHASAELAKQREDDILKEKLEQYQQQQQPKLTVVLEKHSDADVEMAKEKSAVKSATAPAEVTSKEPEEIIDKMAMVTSKAVAEASADVEVAAVEQSKSREEEGVIDRSEDGREVKVDDEQQVALTASKDRSSQEDVHSVESSKVQSRREPQTVTKSRENDPDSSTSQDVSVSVATELPCTEGKVVSHKDMQTVEKVKHTEDVALPDNAATTQSLPVEKSTMAGGGDQAVGDDVARKEVVAVAAEAKCSTEDRTSDLDAETIVQKVNVTESKPQTNVVGVQDVADGRRSFSDDSSDAYTDVLEEEDETDHLSDILEKDVVSSHPPAVEYTELNEDSSAALESVTEKDQATATEEQTEKELDSILDDSHLDESEHDERPYSERTTSSEPSEFEDDDEEFKALEQENTQLIMEEEELMAIGDELRQKIRTEKREIERLHQDIAEIQMIREDMYDSDDSTSSSDDSDDSEDLREILQQLIRDNEELELENADLCDKIHMERQICIAVKVQNRMMQQRNLELSGFGIDDRESLL
jgi:RalA-binding protein 1